MRQSCNCLSRNSLQSRLSQELLKESLKMQQRMLSPSHKLATVTLKGPVPEHQPYCPAAVALGLRRIQPGSVFPKPQLFRQSVRQARSHLGLWQLERLSEPCRKIRLMTSTASEIIRCDRQRRQQRAIPERLYPMLRLA